MEKCRLLSNNVFDINGCQLEATTLFKREEKEILLCEKHAEEAEINIKKYGRLVINIKKEISKEDTLSVVGSRACGKFKSKHATCKNCNHKHIFINGNICKNC